MCPSASKFAVPQATSLTVKTVNGGITVSDIRGSLRFEATNGGINLRRLAGDVQLWFACKRRHQSRTDGSDMGMAVRSR